MLRANGGKTLRWLLRRQLTLLWIYLYNIFYHRFGLPAPIISNARRVKLSTVYDLRRKSLSRYGMSVMTLPAPVIHGGTPPLVALWTHPITQQPGLYLLRGIEPVIVTSLSWFHAISGITQYKAPGIAAHVLPSLVQGPQLPRSNTFLLPSLRPALTTNNDSVHSDSHLPQPLQFNDAGS